MSLISASSLGLTIGALDIFSGISFELPNDAKVGLVGPNGVGKTSLFRILAGISPPSTGSVHLAKGIRIGYLRQEAVEAFAGHDHSVYDEMLTVFAGLREQEAELRAMESHMAAGDSSPELLESYGATQHEFERRGGYDYEVRIRQVLEGLGFKQPQWATSMSHLSGGQKTRALLARLLLEQPSLLMLDEPTNHLDVQATEWLEKSLRSWQGALLIASHDRYFLDRVVDRIWEMSESHIEVYRGNYTAYTQQRQERWQRNHQLYQTEMENLRREMELVRRYIAWRKFDEAWGKLKLLSQKLMAIERFGIVGFQGKSWAEVGARAKMMTIEEAHERIKAIKPPPGRPPQLHVRLRPDRRSGNIVLRARNLQIGHGNRPLFSCDDIHLDRLERVAIIGPNGSGKTTFLRTIVGELPPVSGEIQLGAGLITGYFAQAHDALDRSNTVLDELLRHKNLPLRQARNYLAQYLFRGDDVYKEVGTLSGGERGRLALAVLALDGVNFLLLDEPTNHLDIPAQEVLQEGLEHFDGTLLLVSHDRYLISELATQIWELRDGRLHIYRGTYAEYLEAMERDQEKTREKTAAAAATRPTKQDLRQAARQEREERRRAQLVGQLEEQIAAAEAALAEASRRLESCPPGSDVGDVMRLASSYSETEAELRRLMEEWTSVAG